MYSTHLEFSYTSIPIAYYLIHLGTKILQASLLSPLLVLPCSQPAFTISRATLVSCNSSLVNRCSCARLESYSGSIYPPRTSPDTAWLEAAIDTSLWKLIGSKADPVNDITSSCAVFHDPAYFHHMIHGSWHHTDFTNKSPSQWALTSLPRKHIFAVKHVPQWGTPSQQK
jgi:hypothetical protein